MSRDLRKYARSTNIRGFIGFLLILIFVGSGLIYVFYGPGAVVSGLLCMLAGLLPLVLIGVIMWGLDVVVQRANRDED
jgi:hypothetical protein